MILFYIQLNIEMDDDLCSLVGSLQSSSIDESMEYEKLEKSMKFSIDELLLASEKVISSSTSRYLRYLKYINFDTSEDLQLIKTKIYEYMSSCDSKQKIMYIKQIDKMLIDEVNRVE